jgi:2-C-methyl-D-erythritol 2,4-cyclodiphosphate synthase
MMDSLRIGFGYDVHQLAPGRKFILGGLHIPHKVGPVAHSDGDVLIHAICDALLGAAGLGDIGLHFPDTSNEYKGIDSKELLKKVINLLSREGYKPVNIDSTVALEQPKLRDHIAQMRSILSGIMNLNLNSVNIKATTTEKMGFVGRQEGISAYAVALISKN